MRKQLLATTLAATMALGLAACGGGNGSGSGDKADDKHTYDIWLYSAQDSSYYTSYNDNPVVQYLMGKKWNDQTIALNFLVPPAGSQQNNYETMVTSGDFPTMMQNSVAESAPRMLEDGLIVDIDELVRANMPNYVKLIESTPEVKSKVVENIGGQEKILSIAQVNNDYKYYFSGPMYRRDWIVKYGTNPQTGAAFTGGYTDESDPDSWTDDVVFPCGEQDPLYISDWEWMFDIFEKAQADLGITDSYCTSIYYPGFTWSGGLCSCFGDGLPIWYKDRNDKIQFGGTQDSMRYYLECLNNWYEKGWLDPDFNERTSDIFYGIDDTNIRTGRVGMWTGIEGELGGRLDLHDGGTTLGIYVAGACWPINDIYGTDECKGKEPWCIANGTSLVGTGFYVMSGAEDKDLATLFQMLDYLYSDEGAKLLTLGLSKEQLTEVPQSAQDFYAKYNMSEGAYIDNGDGTYKYCDAYMADPSKLLVAGSANLLPGLCLVNNVDTGMSPNYDHSRAQWIKYKNKGMFYGSKAENNASVDDAKIKTDIHAKVLGYEEQNAYKFIKGDLDIHSDDDWGTWCKTLEKYNVQRVIDTMQPYIDANPEIY